MITERQFDYLVRFIDRNAGRKHKRNGSVARTLREILATHEIMLRNTTMIYSGLPDVRLTGPTAHICCPCQDSVRLLCEEDR